MMARWEARLEAHARRTDEALRSSGASEVVQRERLRADVRREAAQDARAFAASAPHAKITADGIKDAACPITASCVAKGSQLHAWMAQVDEEIEAARLILRQLVDRVDGVTTDRSQSHWLGQTDAPFILEEL